MATSAVQFKNYLAQFNDQIESLIQAVDTWAGNKADSNPNFDYTTAQADLVAAEAAFVTAVETVAAL